jgi:hypothetical protein
MSSIMLFVHLLASRIFVTQSRGLLLCVFRRDQGTIEIFVTAQVPP